VPPSLEPLNLFKKTSIYNFSRKSILNIPVFDVPLLDYDDV